MRRRDLLKQFGYLGLAASLPIGSRLALAEEGYSGRLLVTLQVVGGWDVTSFCDPKTNQPGELEINEWANSADIEQVGNIKYAPITGNRSFFEKYHQHMLVINAIDAQTNSHDAGVTHNASGLVQFGYPSLSAVFAAAQAPDLPLTYISNGGFNETARLVRASRFGSVDQLAGLVRENGSPDENIALSAPIYERLQQFQTQRRSRLLAQDDLTERQRYNRQAFDVAVSRAGDLARLADILPSPDSIRPSELLAGEVLTINAQIQVGVLAMRAGISSAVDLIMPGFDTHGGTAGGDAEQQVFLEYLTNAIDWFWEYAGEQGVADRVTLFITSDFGRTPFYNSYRGKDHWPIGSAIVMEANPSWGNRVFGATDEGHNSLPINPVTGEADESGGGPLYPQDVHQALREYLGIASSEAAQRYPFPTATPLALFT